jgi:hypothetical protein
MCDLFFGDNFLFGEDLHCVDAPGVLFPDLEDTAECAPADKLQKLEIAWGERSSILLDGRESEDGWAVGRHECGRRGLGAMES